MQDKKKKVLQSNGKPTNGLSQDTTGTIQNYTFPAQDLKEHALRLAEAGYQPIPLQGNSKAPSVAWKEYMKRKMTKEEIEKFKWHGIGMILGAISGGLVVFDADTPMAVELLENHPILRDTAKVRTPTKEGIHYYLRVKDYPQKGIKNKPLYKGEIKIDLKGEGGYVVIPPTEINGKQYEWLNLLEYTKVLNFSEFERLLEEIEQAVKRWDKWEKTLALLENEHQEGKRQHLILYTTGYLAKKGIPEFEAITYLSQLMRKKNDEEIEQRIRAIKDTYRDLITQGPQAIAGWKKLQEALDLAQETLTEIEKIWSDVGKSKKEEAIKGSEEVKGGVWKGRYLIVDGEVQIPTRKGFEVVGPYIEVKAVLFNEEEEKRYVVACYRGREFYFTMSEAKEKIEEFTAQAIRLRKEYLAWLSDEVKELPEKRLLKSTGWSEDLKEFYHPVLESEDKDWVFDKEHVLKAEKRAIIRYPEVKKQLVYKALKEGKYLGVLYVCSFTAPLLQLLDIEPFMVIVTGKSRSGKSLATQLATQLFYKNMPAIANGLQTRNSWEFHLTGFRDMPFLFDELTLMDKEMVEFIAFAVHSGYGKSRGRVDKSVNRTMIRSVVLANAERFPYRAIKNAGAHRRVLHLKVKSSEDITSMVISEIEKKAVGFGFELIEFAKKVLEEEKDIIDEKFGHLPSIHKALEIALYIFEKYFGEEFDATRQAIDKIINEQEKTFAEENDHVQKFLERLTEDLAANSGYYVGSEGYKGDTTRLRGKVEETKEGKVVYLLTSTFEELLKEKEEEVLNRDIILKELKETGRLKTDKDRNTTTTWINKSKVRVYAIILKEEATPDPEDDEADVSF